MEDPRQQVSGVADGLARVLRQHPASPGSTCGSNDRCLEHRTLDRLVLRLLLLHTHAAGALLVSGCSWPTTPPSSPPSADCAEALARAGCETGKAIAERKGHRKLLKRLQIVDQSMVSQRTDIVNATAEDTDIADLEQRAKLAEVELMAMLEREEGDAS